MTAVFRTRLRACRSFHLTPGSRPETLPAARAAGGDGIMIDLESNVAPADKVRARDTALAFLRQPPQPDFVRILRINSPRTVEGLHDLLALREAGGPAAVVIPKCEGADEVGVVADILDGARSTIGIIPMIELARAVFVAHHIAQAHERVYAVTHAHSVMTAIAAANGSVPVLNGHAVEPAMVREAERVVAIADRQHNH